MNLRAAAIFAGVISFAAVICQRGFGQMDSWRADRELSQDLMKNGVAIDTDRAQVYFEGGAMESDQMIAFSKLINQGILDVEAFLDITPPANPRKIRYYISSGVDISHSNPRSIYLPLAKVQNHTAPYLHETTHVVAPCDECPMWFSEGLASYVQSYVSEHTGGYDGQIFSRHGNKGIDQDARRWLATPRGEAVVPFIGVHGEPPAINYDRSNVAAPFYVMSQSFVKYLAEQATFEKLRAVFLAKDFDSELEKATGKSAATWKEQWLTALKPQS